MSTENLSLLKAIGAKMDYLNQRQRVISQNIANTDTPGYRPHDLEKVDFANAVKKITDTNGKNVSLETTKAGHMPPPNEIQNPDERKAKKTYEIAPVGNSVVIEEQLINSNKTMMDYNLMTNLYQKNIGMMRTALGR